MAGEEGWIRLMMWKGSVLDHEEEELEREFEIAEKLGERLKK